jgi:hypothetical protein
MTGFYFIKNTRIWDIYKKETLAEHGEDGAQKQDLAKSRRMYFQDSL